MSVNWEGNKYALEFSFMLESQTYDFPSPYLDWSIWSAHNNMSIDYLDEGFYTFLLKSRIGNQEDNQAFNISFEIDNISGCAVRLYPLYQEVKPETNFSLYVYIEECPDFMLLDLILEYNQDELEYINIDNSKVLGLVVDLFQVSSMQDGSINIVTGLLNGNSLRNYNVNGNIELVKLDFYTKNNFGQNEITINSNSICRNLHYQDIGFNGISAILNSTLK